MEVDIWRVWKGGVPVYVGGTSYGGAQEEKRRRLLSLFRVEEEYLCQWRKLTSLGRKERNIPQALLEAEEAWLTLIGEYSSFS